MQRVYLDANATTPLDPRVREQMRPWLDCGNASSPHAEGRAARSAIDGARERVAGLIGAAPRDIVFTSGATEANALALLGHLAARRPRPARVACSAVEHPSVLRTLQALGPAVELVTLPVDRLGRVAADAPLPPDTPLLSVMLANNETGAVMPVRALAERAREHGAVVHSDAVQACGKLAVDVEELGVDLLTLSAHKMGGPKGAGALFVRRGVPVAPLYRGGEHERGLRPGTENVAAIVGLGAAAELARREVESRRRLWAHLRAVLLDGLRSAFPEVAVNSPDDGVPNTISLTFPDLEGEALLLGLDLEGVAVATGSACSSGAAEPSHVLQALGLSRAEAERSIRISLHSGSSKADVLACLTAMERVVKKLRSLQT